MLPGRSLNLQIAGSPRLLVVLADPVHFATEAREVGSIGGKEGDAENHHVAPLSVSAEFFPGFCVRNCADNAATKEDQSPLQDGKDRDIATATVEGIRAQAEILERLPQGHEWTWYLQEKHSQRQFWNAFHHADGRRQEEQQYSLKQHQAFACGPIGNALSGGEAGLEAIRREAQVEGGCAWQRWANGKGPRPER